MARLGVAGIALALVLAPDIAMAAVDSVVGAPPVPPMPVTRAIPMPSAPMMHRPMMAPPMMSAPVGRDAYRQPGYGYSLPRYWVAPEHFIADPRGYGLPQPAWGYGWSRYYDDAVLTDRWGRVYDWRSADDMRGHAMGGRHHKRRDRGGRHDRYGDAGPMMRPHWDVGYVPGPDCNCEEPVAMVEPPPLPCREVKTVSYVTEYVTVPVRAKVAPRSKYVPVHRPKYVPRTKEVPVA